MTITTADGTILATFKKQVPEIDLLVEEQDSVTLDVGQYEPFVNDPPVLKVDKQTPQPAVAAPSLPTTTGAEHLPDSQSAPSPPSQNFPSEPETAVPSEN